MKERKTQLNIYPAELSDNLSYGQWYNIWKIAHNMCLCFIMSDKVLTRICSLCVVKYININTYTYYIHNMEYTPMKQKDMDYLFWRKNNIDKPELDRDHYPWIIWYIWKARMINFLGE